MLKMVELLKSESVLAECEFFGHLITLVSSPISGEALYFTARWNRFTLKDMDENAYRIDFTAYSNWVMSFGPGWLYNANGIFFRSIFMLGGWREK